ncbi:ABC transporter ATP-binding protein [Cellulosilyticum sp. ST5]|uniref:Taurine-transporting ATPase n=1 Tax=Cellulosilyticum lentocellum (strain ATCC 49066 / DSM 5427 / NCIMB 11756 / RHM5) TaxID=642492 RepID=F2JP18_CELLD|nr:MULTISPECIES: ABC transporter ATP-binding protein [Cellulosilyticum]ADZ83632.1 Taurine-transporting ATPase [Cellulosilyticum lentocellum DSM 5427]QEH69012.1 ABC transporter ATP-binding protein [Cellulosilyticum sp. WCF-2]
MNNRIELQHIDKSFYTDEGEIIVLKDLSLNLKPGKILALLGPSGSGKSTVLNILTDLIKPSSGKVMINGKIGYMFQHDHLLEWRTIMDNVTIGLEIQKKLSEENRHRVEVLLENYGLGEFKNRFPKELSGGMRQRAALIRTLATNPDILLLDEPFSALDYQTRLLVSDDIYGIIKKEHKEAILVTHDISEAISMADEISVLSKRPAYVKHTYEIHLTVAGDRTPLSSRKAPEFKDYFDILWKELETNE